MKRREVLIYAAKWTAFVNTLSERGPSQETTCPVTPFMGNVQVGKLMELVSKLLGTEGLNARIGR